MSSQRQARQVTGMGEMTKVDTWREADGTRVDKLIMRPNQDMYAHGLCDLACYP